MPEYRRLLGDDNEPRYPIEEPHPHLVWAEGPPCDENCPGETSQWHDGYAWGTEKILREIREEVVGHGDEDPFDLLYMFFVGLLGGNARLSKIAHEQIEECRASVLDMVYRREYK